MKLLITTPVKLTFVLGILLILSCKFKNSFTTSTSFLNGENYSSIKANEKIEIKHIFKQLDLVSETNDDPKFLFKYNLAKINFLKNGRNISAAHAQAFSNYIEKVEFRDVLEHAKENKLIDQFGYDIFFDLYQNLEDVDILKSKYPEIKTKEPFDILYAIVNSYETIIEAKQSSENDFPVNHICADCLIKCVESFTFSSEWWHNYHVGLELCFENANSYCNYHAYYYAESIGLTLCESNNCKGSCEDKQQDLALLYQ